MLGLVVAGGLPGQTTNDDLYPIDLPTALRLAGAQNLEVQIARERLKEAEANHSSAIERFFPWVSPGIGYHRRDGVAQAVPSGVISDAHYQSYSPGATLGAQVVLGDAIYNSLAAKQLVKASGQRLEADRQAATLKAAAAYWELAKTAAIVNVIKESLNISRDYQGQLHDAVASGIAFKGDALRVETQTRQLEVNLRQAREQERQAALDLALVLHLDPKLELLPQETGLTRLTLFEPGAALSTLVERALRTRPEFRESQALVAAARAATDGAVYGPLVPSLGAQVYGGGLGGGPDGGAGNFAAAGDYALGLSWRIGPGGLFDSGRVESTRAGLAIARLNDEKLRDVVTSEVVASAVRVQSLADQIGLVEANLTTSAEALRLTRDRKQFGVGMVLEDIQAQQDLERARKEYVRAVADYNKAQFGLNRAVGGSVAESILIKK